MRFGAGTPVRSARVGNKPIFHQAVIDLTLRQRPRPAHNERHAYGRIEQTELLIESMIAIHLSVVARIDDDRVLQQIQFFERLIKFADACIDVSKVTEIPGAMLPKPLRTRFPIGFNLALHSPGMYETSPTGGSSIFSTGYLSAQGSGGCSGGCGRKKLAISRNGSSPASTIDDESPTNELVVGSSADARHIRGSHGPPRTQVAPDRGQLRQAAAVVIHGVKEFRTDGMIGDLIGIMLHFSDPDT